MIFKQHQQVLDGAKTQTRRLCKEFDQFAVMHDGSKAVVRRGRILWQTGHTYSIQPGRGKKAVGRIRLTKIRRGRLQDINILDIYAEGIEPAPLVGAEATIMMERYAFANLWNSIYAKEGERFEDNPEVWALTFEVT